MGFKSSFKQMIHNSNKRYDTLIQNRGRAFKYN